MLQGIGIVIMVLAAVLAVAAQSPAKELAFEEVCVPAKALGLAGREWARSPS